MLFEKKHYSNKQKAALEASLDYVEKQHSLLVDRIDPFVVDRISTMVDHKVPNRSGDLVNYLRHTLK